MYVDDAFTNIFIIINSSHIYMINIYKLNRDYNIKCYNIINDIPITCFMDSI